MRPELEKIELIEKYLLGRLHGEDLKEFERELHQDADLREEIETQRLFVKGLENSGLRKTLDHIHYSLYDTPSSFLLRNWIKLAGGAFVVVTVAFIVLIKKQNSDVKNKNIFSDQQQVSIGSPGEIEEEIFSYESLKDFNLNKNTTPAIFNIYKNPLEKFFSSNLIKSNFYSIDPARDTLITGANGTKILIPPHCFTYSDGTVLNDIYSFELKEIYKKSDILINNMASNANEALESTGGVYINATQGNRQLKFAENKKISINFYSIDDAEAGSFADDSLVKKPIDKISYYKVFDDKPERRLILLPSVVLDYDIVYTKKTSDPLMNERMESLLLPRYDKTFTSTTQFHYRIEGCQLYSEKTELLDIYLNNTHLKLWEADSLVINYLVERAQADCENYDRYMKEAEYFRWLKSFRHGNVHYVPQLIYRNYRKGQMYNKMPDKILEKYLSESGLNNDESTELITYFKKMFVFKKMFYKRLKLRETNKEDAVLDYYYSDQGKFVGFEKINCEKKVDKEKYIYKTGNSIASATELNYFMPVNKLGWINCERFVNYKNISPLKVSLLNLDTSSYSKVYIVFKKIRSVMGGEWGKSSLNFFEKVPKGTSVYLIALSYSGDKIYYARKEIITGERLIESLEMKMSDEKMIRNDLLKIDY